MTPRLYFEYSSWFFIVCLLVGAAYALLLYFRVKNPWGVSTNRMLFFLRFSLIALLAGLLVGPFLRLTNNTYEKPLVVFAIDNSSSMKLTRDSLQLNDKVQALREARDALSSAGYETRSRSLESVSLEDEIDFNYPETDLAELMKQIANDYEGFNLSSVVLFSDGIYNTGISPTFRTYDYPIYTIGAGDTTKNKDIRIQNVLYNKISYQGNKFPVIVDLSNEGFVGENVRVEISKRGKTLESSEIQFTANNQVRRVEFLLEADEVGLQRYLIAVQGKSDEFTLTNNRSQVFIDVVDGREKILLLASAPHPDLKAFAGAIESNENYELETYIAGVHDWPEDLNDIDLIVYHQVPDYKQVLGTNLKKVQDLDVPTLYVVGAKTNVGTLNEIMTPIQMVRTRNESDMISAIENENFGLFEMSDDLRELINQLPPVRAPFGPIVVDGESNILLHQKVGSITTDRPLILFTGGDESKRGVIFAEGIFKWRLADYAINKTTDRFDELILKSIQYLTTKDDRRKFRLYSRKNEYVEKEQVFFQAEAYNALYEPLYGIKVDVSLSREGAENQDFTFVTSQSNSSFSVRNLVPGIYTYTGTANVNGELSTSSGEFVVMDLNIESTNLTADHHLLRDLATASGGQFYDSNLEELTETLIATKPPEIIHTSEQFLPLINLKWAFFMLLLLISTEWFVRKYQGGY